MKLFTYLPHPHHAVFYAVGYSMETHFGVGYYYCTHSEHPSYAYPGQYWQDSSSPVLYLVLDKALVLSSSLDNSHSGREEVRACMSRFLSIV